MFLNYIATHIFSHTSVEVAFAILVGFIALTQRHSNEKVQMKLDSNREVILLQMDENEKDKNTQFEHVETRLNFLAEGLKILQDTVKRLDLAMEKYAITNHDVLNDELIQIDAVIYMSATSVANIVKNAIHATRAGQTTIARDDLIKLVAADVEEDRRKFHSELTIKGVPTKTISLWEEVEREAFEGFMFRIIQTFEKLVTLTGNGTVDMLVDRECELLRDFLYTEFMKRFKRRLSVVK